MTEQPIITRAPTKEGAEPALAVELHAKAPIIEHNASSKGDDKHGEWTLDLLERTLFEFRAAGAWDGAKVKLVNGGYYVGPVVSCEVMIGGRGEDALPWGWRPSQGPPPPRTYTALPDPVIPDVGPTPVLDAIGDLLGSRVLHGVLLLVLVGLAVVFR